MENFLFGLDYGFLWEQLILAIEGSFGQQKLLMHLKELPLDSMTSCQETGLRIF